MVARATAVEAAPSYESVIARLERLPISRELTVARIVIGSATFFDAYTVLAIAYAPLLKQRPAMSRSLPGLNGCRFLEN
jgi:hypothetical protein